MTRNNYVCGECKNTLQGRDTRFPICGKCWRVKNPLDAETLLVKILKLSPNDAKKVQNLEDGYKHIVANLDKYKQKKLIHNLKLIYCTVNYNGDFEKHQGFVEIIDGIWVSTMEHDIVSHDCC